MDRNLKEDLKKACLDQVAENINSAQQLLQNIIESKLNDTKSSAGDKFETTRERLQAEEDRVNAVLMNSKKLEHKIKILKSSSCDKVEAGAIVRTDKANYYIAVGLGKILVNGTAFYLISPDAPLSKIMWNKKLGDKFHINNSLQTIIAIE